jgi:arylsulfatase
MLKKMHRDKQAIAPLRKRKGPIKQGDCCLRDFGAAVWMPATPSAIKNVLLFSSGEALNLEEDTSDFFTLHVPLLMPSNTSPPPNLLFILSDQHRWDTLEWLRPGQLRTPHFARLRSEGAWCSEAFTVAQPCLPSRASLLTSRYPELHRAWNNADLLPPSERTWVQALKDNGYQCTAVGRTHHVDRGFETVRVPYGKSYPMIDYTHVHEVPWGKNGILETSPAALEEFYEVRVAQTACNLMEDFSRNQPFALYVGFIAPHPPFVLPEPFASAYDPAKIEVDPTSPPPLAFAKHSAAYYEGRPHTEEQLMAAYYGLVSMLDHCVGMLLEKLDQLGLAENTLVVYTSDHGEQMGHRKLWNKGYAYDSSIRIPLLIRKPGDIPAGSEPTGLIESVDIGPTILEALGQPAMKHRSGKSFLPMLRGMCPGHRDWIYSTEGAGHLALYRDKQWKYAHWLKKEGWGESFQELYDLVNDPREENNLASDPRQAARMRELADKLWTHQRSACLESMSALHPESRQKPTFNAQF